MILFNKAILYNVNNIKVIQTKHKLNLKKWMNLSFLIDRVLDFNDVIFYKFLIFMMPLKVY